MTIVLLLLRLLYISLFAQVQKNKITHSRQTDKRTDITITIKLVTHSPGKRS